MRKVLIRVCQVVVAILIVLLVVELIEWLGVVEF